MKNLKDFMSRWNEWLGFIPNIQNVYYTLIKNKRKEVVTSLYFKIMFGFYYLLLTILRII